MDTLMLSPDWDLMLDAKGNIAVANGAYAIAQDVASQCKLFQGELWYDTTQGIPYWQSILGRLPPIQLMNAKYVAAALLVPGVAKAKSFIATYLNRNITGQIQITTDTGATVTATVG